MIRAALIALTLQPAPGVMDRGSTDSFIVAPTPPLEPAAGSYVWCAVTVFDCQQFKFVHPDGTVVRGPL